MIARRIAWCGTPMQKLPRMVAVEFATLHAVPLGHAWLYGGRCMQKQPLAASHQGKAEKCTFALIMLCVS